MFPRQPNKDKTYKEDQRNGTHEVNDVRKYMHREIERQRRQEMANLCGSLRTLLPVQYNNKGKLSVSDRVQEAVNYIKDKQNNINQLKNRKDKLKKLTKLPEENQSTSRDDCRNSVTVNPSSDGVEILIMINASFEDEEGDQLPLSIILKELIEVRGFNVVSCLSTNADHGRTLHKIQLEVTNPRLKDFSGLQERLTFLINCLPQ